MSKWISMVGGASLFLLVGSAGANVQAEAPSANPEGWELVKKDETIVLYERSIPGSPVIAFRGEGILTAPIAKVASVILDQPHAPEWVDSLEEARVLRRIGPMEYIEYNHIGTPFVMKDREFVTHVWIQVDPKAKTMALQYKSVDDPMMPESASKYVRGELINSRFVLTSLDGGKKTSLMAEIHADPKGSVPKWIVNLFQRSWPRVTFKGIQEQLNKPNRGGVPAGFENIISQLTF